MTHLPTCYLLISLLAICSLVAVEQPDAWREWSAQEWSSADGPLPPAPVSRLRHEREALLAACRPGTEAMAVDWVRYGRICLAQQETDAARTAFDAALAIDADLPSAHLHHCFAGADLQAHLPQLAPGQLAMLLAVELRRFQRLTEGLANRDRDMPFTALARQSDRLSRLLADERLSPAGSGDRLRSHLDRAHWLLHFPITLDRYSADAEKRQRAERELLRAAHHRLCEQLLQPTPLGRTAFCHFVHLSPWELPAEELQAAAARVLADGAIDRPILASEWQPSQHHEGSRWDAYDLLPGPLATAAVLEQGAGLAAVAEALTALRSLPDDPAPALAHLTALPEAEVVHFWQALLLTAPATLSSTGWKALSERLQADLVAGRLPRNGIGGLLVAELAQRAPEPAVAVDWLLALIGSTDRAADWAPVIAPLTARAETCMLGLLVKQAYDLRHWAFTYKPSHLIWSQTQDGGIGPWLAAQLESLPDERLTDEPWRLPELPQRYYPPMNILQKVLFTRSAWRADDQQALIDWSRERYGADHFLTRLFDGALHLTGDDWRNGSGMTPFLRVVAAAQAVSGDRAADFKKWLLQVRGLFSLTTRFDDVSAPAELTAAYRWLYGEREERVAGLAEELLRLDDIGAVIRAIDDLQEASGIGDDATAFLTHLLRNDPAQARAVIDHALDLATRDKAGILFNYWIWAAQKCDRMDLVVHLARAVVGRPVQIKDHADRYMRCCLAFLGERAGVAEPDSAESLSAAVVAMDRVFRTSVPSQSALFLFDYLTRWDPLDTHSNRQQRVEQFLQQTAGESGPLLAVVRAAAAMRLLRHQRWSRKEKNLAQRRQGWAGIVTDLIRQEGERRRELPRVFTAFMKELVLMQYDLRYPQGDELVLLDDRDLLSMAVRLAEEWPTRDMPLEDATTYAAITRLVADLPRQKGWREAAAALLAAGAASEPVDWHAYTRDLFDPTVRLPHLAFDRLSTDMELLRLACLLDDEEAMTTLLTKEPPQPPLISRRRAGVGGLAGTSGCYHILFTHGQAERAVALLRQHRQCIYHRPGLCRRDPAIDRHWPTIAAAIDDADLAELARTMLAAIPSIDQAFDDRTIGYEYDRLDDDDQAQRQRMRVQAQRLGEHAFDDPAIGRACLLYFLDFRQAARPLIGFLATVCTALLDGTPLPGLDVRWHERLWATTCWVAVAGHRFAFIADSVAEMCRSQPDQDRHQAVLRLLARDLSDWLRYTDDVFAGCSPEELQHLTDYFFALHRLPEPLAEAFVASNGDALAACCVVTGRTAELDSFFQAERERLDQAMAGKLRWEGGLRLLIAIANQAAVPEADVAAWLQAYRDNPLHQAWNGRSPKKLAASLADLAGLSDADLVQQALVWAELTKEPVQDLAGLARQLDRQKRPEAARACYQLAKEHPSFADLKDKDQAKIEQALRQ